MCVFRSYGLFGFLYVRSNLIYYVFIIDFCMYFGLTKIIIACQRDVFATSNESWRYWIYLLMLLYEYMHRNSTYKWHLGYTQAAKNRIKSMNVVIWWYIHTHIATGNWYWSISRSQTYSVSPQQLRSCAMHTSIMCVHFCSFSWLDLLLEMFDFESALLLVSGRSFFMRRVFRGHMHVPYMIIASAGFIKMTITISMGLTSFNYSSALSININ